MLHIPDYSTLSIYSSQPLPFQLLGVTRWFTQCVQFHLLNTQSIYSSHSSYSVVDSPHTIPFTQYTVYYLITYFTILLTEWNNSIYSTHNVFTRRHILHHSSYSVVYSIHTILFTQQSTHNLFTHHILYHASYSATKLAWGEGMGRNAMGRVALMLKVSHISLHWCNR